MNKNLLCSILVLFLAVTLSPKIYAQTNERFQDILIKVPAFNSQKSLAPLQTSVNNRAGVVLVKYYQTAETFHFRIDRTLVADNAFIKELLPDFNYDVIQEPTEVSAILDILDSAKPVSNPKESE